MSELHFYTIKLNLKTSWASSLQVTQIQSILILSGFFYVFFNITLYEMLLIPCFLKLEVPLDQT